MLFMFVCEALFLYLHYSSTLKLFLYGLGKSSFCSKSAFLYRVLSFRVLLEIYIYPRNNGLVWFLSFRYSRFFFLIFYNSVCYWAWKTRFEYIHKCLFIMIYYVISHGECLFLSENSDLANSIFLFLRIQALTLCYLSSPPREPHNCALWLTNIDDPLSFHEQITPQIIREKKRRDYTFIYTENYLLKILNLVYRHFWSAKEPVLMNAYITPCRV